MDLLELLFICEASENQASCSVWDHRTGTNLITYKGGGVIQKRSLSLLRTQYVLGANSAKPLLHVWPMNHQEQISAVRFVLPGRVDALALSTDYFYLVAGIQETLYIWHLTTGRMLNMINRHYQTITCLRFTDCGSHFVSASRDGGILVWNLTQVVSRSSTDENQKPLYSFSDHGLPVTDVHIGKGAMRANMFTCSIDRSCKVYDLSNGNLLLSVVFAEALTCVIADALETCVYVGSIEGNVYEFHIDSVPRIKEYHMEKDHSNKFNGHKEKTSVNCLALSLDGQALISGGQDNQVCIWHIKSRQLLKTMQFKGAITNLELRLMHPNAFDPEHKQPQVFGGNLRRMLDSSEIEEDEAMEILVTEQSPTDWENFFAVPHKSSATASTSIGEATATTNDSEEIEKLRAEVQQLKKINKQLYETAVHNTLFPTK